MRYRFCKLSNYYNKCYCGPKYCLNRSLNCQWIEHGEWLL